MGRYCLVLDGTGSVSGVTIYYMMVLGQYRTVLDGNWWYWVSRRRYWLVFGGTVSVGGGTGGTGSVKLDTAWYLVLLG